MKLRQLLTASIALSITQAAMATEPLFPQPIDVAAAVGTEQSDFFVLRYAKGSKLVFSALVKEIKATKTKGAQDQRAMFAQRIETLGGQSTFFEVDTLAPLTKLTAFTVPAGTVFDSFLFNGNAENEQGAQGFPEEFFHVPTKGIYFSTGGSAPVLVRAETAAAPTDGFALQNPNFMANDHDVSEAFRIVLGATDKKKGLEPFISQGASRTTVALHPLAAPTVTISNPGSFTTFSDPVNGGKNVVYFLGSNPAGGNYVYKATVDTSERTARYGAVQVTAAGLTDPADLTGSNDGLMYSDSLNGVRQLFVSSDGTDSFAMVTGAGADPQNFVPNVVTGLNGTGSTNLSGTGFTAVDGSNNRRFQVLSNVVEASAVYTDTTAAITDPTDIINTGSYFYYGGVISGTRYAVKDFNGATDQESLILNEAGKNLINPSEFTFVDGRDPSGLDGTVYFTAQVLGDSVSTPLALYKIAANDTTDHAHLVLTVANSAVKDNPNAIATAPVTSAHNLRNVTDGTISRLYFCAPVTDTENSQWRPMEKVGKTLQPVSVGTKPWVLSDE